jgi:stage V sporulation protein G
VQLTEIRINLCGRGPLPSVPKSADAFGQAGSALSRASSRLRAFCSLTFDDTFVIRDVKLIEGNDGLFLAMPSRKLSDHCPRCGEKNHLRARFCNGCGRRLDDDRHLRYRTGNGINRLKLHADIAHPINVKTRQLIERQVYEAYEREVERSQLPDYVPPSLDAEDFEFYDDGPAGGAQKLFPPLRPTGTALH